MRAMVFHSSQRKSSQRPPPRNHKATFEQLESRAMLQGNPFIGFTGNVSGQPSGIATVALPPLAIQTVVTTAVSVPATSGTTAPTVSSSAAVGAGLVLGSPAGTVFGLQVGATVNAAVNLGGAGMPTSPGMPGSSVPGNPIPNGATTQYSNELNRLIDELTGRSGIQMAARKSITSSGITNSQSGSAAVPVVPPEQ